ncbi:MAG TPA: hypothetical protein VGM91_23290 [Conexibacter sp.]|jgi:hypothetical protein
MSAEVMWQFELEEGADAGAVAVELQRRLSAFEPVEEAAVSPPQEERTGLEILAVIATAVVVIRTGRQLTEELTGLIRAVRELVGEVKGVKSAAVDIEGDLIPVEKLEARRLAEATMG